MAKLHSRFFSMFPQQVGTIVENNQYIVILAMHLDLQSLKAHLSHNATQNFLKTEIPSLEHFHMQVTWLSYLVQSSYCIVLSHLLLGTLWTLGQWGRLQNFYLRKSDSSTYSHWTHNMNAFGRRFCGLAKQNFESRLFHRNILSMVMQTSVGRFLAMSNLITKDRQKTDVKMMAWKSFKEVIALTKTSNLVVDLLAIFSWSQIWITLGTAKNWSTKVGRPYMVSSFFPLSSGCYR